MRHLSRAFASAQRPDFRHRFGVLVASDKQPIRAEIPTVRGDDTTAVIRLYDPIDSYGGWWGVSAKEFAGVLDELPESVTEIRLLVNSPGGEVTEGIAILNLLRAHPARVTAVVEGIAASSASVIVAGCDELVMARNSEIFIHDAWGLCVGNATDMRQLADELDHLSDNIASVYAQKAGGTVEEWRALMAAETWFSAEQAVEAGLADSVDVGADPAVVDTAKARFDTSIFKNSGRRSDPGTSGPRAEEGGSDMDPVQLRTSLGLAEDATDEQVTARITELAAAEDRAATAEARVTELETEQQTNVPDGHVVVPEARLNDLEVAAQRGVQAADQLRIEDRTKFLDSMRAKYAPANRAAWEAEYDRDPEGTRKHFATAPDIIPIAQLGSESGDLDTDSREFDDAVRLFGEAEARRMYGMEVPV